MAQTPIDISAYLEQIQTERYAKDMRTALYNAIDGVDKNAKMAVDSSDIAQEAADRANTAANTVEELSDTMHTTLTGYDIKINSAIDSMGTARYLKADFTDGFIAKETIFQRSGAVSDPLSIFLQKGTALDLTVSQDAATAENVTINVLGLVNDEYVVIRSFPLTTPSHNTTIVLAQDIYGIQFQYIPAIIPSNTPKTFKLYLSKPSRLKTVANYLAGVPAYNGIVSGVTSESKCLDCALLKGYEYSLTVDIDPTGHEGETTLASIGYKPETWDNSSIHIKDIPPEGVTNYKFTPTYNANQLVISAESGMTFTSVFVTITPVSDKPMSVQVVPSPVGAGTMASELDIHTSTDTWNRKIFAIADTHTSEYDDLYDAGDSAREYQVTGEEPFLPLYTLDNFKIGHFRYIIFTEMFTQTMFAGFFQYDTGGNILQQSGLVEISHGGSEIDPTVLDYFKIARRQTGTSIPSSSINPNTLYFLMLSDADQNTITGKTIGPHVFIFWRVSETMNSRDYLKSLYTNEVYTRLNNGAWTKIITDISALPTIESYLTDAGMDQLGIRRFTWWDDVSVLSQTPDLTNTVHRDLNNLYGYFRAIRIDTTSYTLNLRYSETITLYKGDTILLYTTPPITRDSADDLYSKSEIYQYGIILYNPVGSEYGSMPKGFPRIIYRRWDKLNEEWTLWAERVVETKDIREKAVTNDKIANFSSSEDLEASESVYPGARIPNTMAVLKGMGGHTFKQGTIAATEAIGTEGQELYYMEGNYQLIGDFCYLTATADLISGASSVEYQIPIPWIAGASVLAADDDEVFIKTYTDTGYDHTLLRISKQSSASTQTLGSGSVSFTIVYRYIDRSS